MSQAHPSVSNFLNSLASGLEESLSKGTEPARVTWVMRPKDAARTDLKWWSCGLSVDTSCRAAAGAAPETWEAIGNAAGAQDGFAAIAGILQRAAQVRFGSEVTCTEAGPSEEAPPVDWTAVTVTTATGELDLALSPGWMAALGAGEPPDAPPPAQAPDLKAIAAHAADMLMHVEIPVSVSLGRAEMRIKDLLALSQGSIVELEQELNDEVEIRLNNAVIAWGEVVAVDGNYGVRIKSMASGNNGRGVRAALAGASPDPKGAE